MPKKSAGLLMYRRRRGELEVFLVHPGGPWWARRDLGSWSIPKGEFSEDEDALAAAKREFVEETGSAASGVFLPLTPVEQSKAKTVTAWAFEGDINPAAIRSNTFPLEWPPGSGRQQEFPEVDRAGWFALDEARKKILKGQIPLLEELARLLRVEE